MESVGVATGEFTGVAVFGDSFGDSFGDALSCSIRMAGVSKSSIWPERMDQINAASPTMNKIKPTAVKTNSIDMRFGSGVRKVYELQ